MVASMYFKAGYSTQIYTIYYTTGNKEDSEPPEAVVISNSDEEDIYATDQEQPHEGEPIVIDDGESSTSSSHILPQPAPVPTITPLPLHLQSPPRSGKKKNAYVVYKGRVPGVYESWDEASDQVDGFLSNRHLGFSTLEDAKLAWQIHLASQRLSHMSLSPPSTQSSNHSSLAGTSNPGVQKHARDTQSQGRSEVHPSPSRPGAPFNLKLQARSNSPAFIDSSRSAGASSGPRGNPVSISGSQARQPQSKPMVTKPAHKVREGAVDDDHWYVVSKGVCPGVYQGRLLSLEHLGRHSDRQRYRVENQVHGNAFFVELFGRREIAILPY